MNDKSTETREYRNYEELENEVSYYKSLLFSDMNPTKASILNALRCASDAVDELRRVRSDSYIVSLEQLCHKLELENSALRSRLGESENVQKESSLNKVCSQIHSRYTV